MTRFCTFASSCPVLTSSVHPEGKLECYRENSGWKRTSSGRFRATKLVVMRSCWFGEEQILQSAFGSRSRRGFFTVQRLRVRAGLEEILHNQVLISGSLAGILGQLVKPVTSALFGKGFNWKLIFKSGGMPSTHSAAVTAAATALGLERGFSDSLFGLAFIYASLFMYDAQGVRRSVGMQAEVINTMVLTYMADSVPQSARPSSAPSPSPYAIGVELARDPVQAELAFMDEAESSTLQVSKSTAVLSKEGSLRLNGTPNVPTRLAEDMTQNGPITRTQMLVAGSERLPSVKDGEVTLEELGNLDGWRHIPLKESVGHTKVEVFVGALWGILVTLALHSSFQ